MSYTAANGSKYTYTYNSAHDVTSAKVGGLTATMGYAGLLYAVDPHSGMLLVRFE